jgi:cytochrome oxidase Cu insertion factor (SCO1/SenC/PrrC family)
MQLDLRRVGAVLAATCALALAIKAQAPTDGPAVGAQAPDFTLPGATRYGVLKNPVHLSDYRGQTVVLAFFYQARTKG